MKPNERRTADGRQPRPSCQLIDRNASINGPRARMHAIPRPLISVSLFSGSAFVSLRWPQVALVAKQQLGGGCVEILEFRPEDRGVWWRRERIVVFDGNLWNFTYFTRFEDTGFSILRNILRGGTENLEENLEVRLDKRDSLFAVRNKTGSCLMNYHSEKCLLSKVNHCLKSTRSSRFWIARSINEIRPMCLQSEA